MKAQRMLAAASLLLLFVGLALLVVVVSRGFPRALVVVGAAALAAGIARAGIVRRGASRTVRLVLALLLVVAGVLIVLTGEALSAGLIAIALIATSRVAARKALRVRAHWPVAPPPSRAVVIWNARSGGGKAVKHDVPTEAMRRGIRPIELRQGDDLEQLVRDAVSAGADGLAAAGGDGTQALVASIAAEHDLPFACIPAGTRNHFALDLGVDRDDVVGALDAFVTGGERRVDLAEVNGRVFVNNVSLGLYAEAVQREGYREAKLRTMLDTMPDVLGSQQTDATSDLGWRGPDGTQHTSAAVILISNNVYRLGNVVGSGSRPRIDGGELGIAVWAPSDDGSRRWLQWSASTTEITSSQPVP